MSDDLEDFEKKLQAARDEHEDKSAGKTLSAGVEFTAPMIGGMVIGFFLDKWLETGPIFVISLFLLGVGAGILNIYKLSQNIGGTVGFSELHQRSKNAKTSPSDDSTKTESEP
ncbi:MAG: F0F1 ATP synthase assembly protein I [Micavibrio sp.]|nr:F0F1 ATP synthase assembly protein I [Micavibrio sp.]|tara:strand:- start:1450 stop:1788 length:339 start_codon:yes stop_codon:yes gene_type:complete